MQKLIGACVMLIIIAALQSKAFAGDPLNCQFKDEQSRVEGIKSLTMADDAMIINDTISIPLEHSKIKCGSFGRQNRFDGLGKGLQIILKSCTDKASLEGMIIDSLNGKVADVICDIIH